jgi:hypothetical protein
VVLGGWLPGISTKIEDENAVLLHPSISSHSATAIKISQNTKL